jgi:hypothetical protein
MALAVQAMLGARFTAIGIGLKCGYFPVSGE